MLAIKHGLRFGAHGLPLMGGGTQAAGQVTCVTVDGRKRPDLRIPMVDDRQDHFVEVSIG